MSRRTEKVEELIRQELAKTIQIELGEKFGIISLNRVFISADLRNANIYVSSLIEEKKDDLVKKLNTDRIKYQRIIGDKLRTRFTPHIEFKVDKSGNAVDKVEELLEKIDNGS